ncbi:hypothetical protein L4C36_17180 [Photobacterium japonica]|uniref:hypothetical protein n=1 Tax=Photobacterium japonica TaxID=2910235 RepID=UPI003D136B07
MDNNEYLELLLKDVQSVVENHQSENSKLYKQLKNLLNRPNEKGEQPFKVQAH